MPRATPRATPAKKAAKKTAASKLVKKTAAKKTTAKTPERRGAGGRLPAKKAAAKKQPVKKAVAKKQPAKKAVAKKQPVKKPAAKKAPERRGAGSASPVKKSAAKIAPALTATPVRKATKKPIKSPFDAKFLEAQRELLLEERATYTRQAATLQAEADALVADFEPGDVQFDEESGEGDTLAVERERDLALSAQARAAVAEIDHALEKITAGTYGVCEVSGLAIPKERLKAIPWARERVEYKAAGIGRL
jgi:RNA polymerase-binding transcription factor DksA